MEEHDNLIEQLSYAEEALKGSLRVLDDIVATSSDERVFAVYAAVDHARAAIEKILFA